MTPPDPMPATGGGAKSLGIDASGTAVGLFFHKREIGRGKLKEENRWRRLFASRGGIRVAVRTRVDRALAVAHCLLFATWCDQLEAAAKHPHVIAHKNRLTKNPARASANQTLTLLVKIDSELGLTATSRSRVRISEGTGAKNLFADIGHLVPS